MKKHRKKGILALFLFVLLGVLFFGVKQKEKSSDSIKEFTAFFNTSGNKLDEENEVKDRIAEITGARCSESWLNGQSEDTAINLFIASGEYPDFISGSKELYEAKALIPIDEYWEDYPNIRGYMEDYEWERLRQSDGHIYWIPQFGVVNGNPEEVIHEGEAFWIQTRVLKWAGYPKVRTLDEYFDLLESYRNANPTMKNGTPNIPYTILCDGWRYFCLENVPQFLDGYPNDGSCMVDTEQEKVLDYNVTPTAKKYFSKLNEAYKKGLVDPESFTQTYEEYVDKLCTGAVLGMVDQWWQFYYTVGPAFVRQKLVEEGCDYVPLPITIDESVKNQWHVKRGNELDVSTGISVTTSCTDIKGALQFINDLLEPEVQNLRFWGVEGLDYQVGKDGLFYRTEEQRERSNSLEFQASHFCSYSYFPRKEGISEDGINAFSPEYQPEEFFTALPKDVKECFKAYGCKNYVEMLGSNTKPGVWYPMYSYSTMLTLTTEPGRVWNQMGETKHIWLPQVVMADDFEGAWQDYMKAYASCSPEIFLNDMQKELERRIAAGDN